MQFYQSIGKFTYLLRYYMLIYLILFCKVAKSGHLFNCYLAILKKVAKSGEL